MKRLTTLCLTLFLVTFAYAEKIPYQFIKDSYLFDSHEAAELYEVSSSVYYHKSKYVICGVEKNKNCFYEIGDWHWISEPFYADYPNDYVSSIEIMLDDGQRGFARLDDLKNLQSCESIHIDLNNIRKQCWVSSDTFEIVNSKSQEVLLKKEPYWVTSWRSGMGEDWQDDVTVSYISFDNKSLYMSSYASSSADFLIESCANDGKDLEINLYTDSNAYLEGEETYISKYSKKGRYKITINFDGDYLRLYDNDSDTYLNFAYTEQFDKIFKLKKSIARNEAVDLSEVVFPRHADGSCDYDDKIIKTHKVGGMYKTEDSLRLRAAEGIAGDAFVTLAAGTCVKVEAIGKEETIDGITSNWVQVRVLDGATDKDGNAVAAGTRGWLFGGYLSPTEYVEPVKEAKKLNLLDSVETKDKRKVNRAVKMNKKEENDDFVFPFIQVGFGIILMIVLLPIILVIAKKKKVNIMTDVYKLIADMICNSIDDKWEKAVVEIESSPWQMLSTSAYYFKDGHKNAFGLIDDNQDEDLGENIFELQESMQSKNKWNRAVYMLEKNGHFDMEFIWDQELQDEWDKA